MTTEFDYDVLVIGSGFGGSVTAVAADREGLPRGRDRAGARFRDEDFATTSWDTRKFLFNPAIGCYGIQRIDAVRDAVILAGACVGGGSLVYATTLYEPLDPFYTDPAWSHITDWKSELAPYYGQAKRMLGVVENPVVTPSDEVMQRPADEMGVPETYHPTPVGVFFGGPDQQEGEAVADPSSAATRRRVLPAMSRGRTVASIALACPVVMSRFVCPGRSSASGACSRHTVCTRRRVSASRRSVSIRRVSSSPSIFSTRRFVVRTATTATECASRASVFRL